MQPISRWELATSTRVTTDTNKLVNGSLIRHNIKLLFTQGRLKDFINGVAQEEPRTKCRQTHERLIGNIYFFNVENWFRKHLVLFICAALCPDAYGMKSGSIQESDLLHVAILHNGETLGCEKNKEKQSLPCFLFMFQVGTVARNYHI